MLLTGYRITTQWYGADVDNSSSGVETTVGQTLEQRDARLFLPNLKKAS